MVNKGNLGYKVTYRTLSWRELAVREWGAEWGIPEVVYEFSNGRRFQSSDMSTHGFYTKT